MSVTDLFADRIALRDLEPRSSAVRGLGALRAQLKLAAPFVPCKNEVDYAAVVLEFIADLAGADVDILYVGDTVFNDGSVICNLSSLVPGRVFGFLGNENGFGHGDDFIIGPVYFGRRWTSLVRFVSEARRRGLAFGKRTVGLFDLDQTVYAAKGRNDSALYQARWTAIEAFLRDIIPPYKYDPIRAEAIYRRFDRDEFHRVTRDNMDYVVLLVLAVASSLFDVSELEAFAGDQNNSIAGLIDLIYRRAVGRRGHEDVERLVEVIRAVQHNTLAGDQTPCKDFRRCECEATGRRMRISASVPEPSIALNREVVDFINFLKDAGACVMALSDRPVEAAVIDEDDMREDLLTIPMGTEGVPIREFLRKHA